MTLREWLEREGLSLREAGERLGMTHARVVQLRDGEMPTMKTADRIEKATGGAVTRLDWPKEGA